MICRFQIIFLHYGAQFVIVDWKLCYSFDSTRIKKKVLENNFEFHVSNNYMLIMSFIYL
jgi:hypothetical protein